MSDVLCNDCLDTGWQWDREGRTPCSCVSETEPYQLLKEENERLSKCCTQRGARMQIMREFIKRNVITDSFGRDKLINECPEAAGWFDADGVPVEVLKDE